jgi:hypothetical protein
VPQRVVAPSATQRLLYIAPSLCAHNSRTLTCRRVLRRVLRRACPFEYAFPAPTLRASIRLTWDLICRPRPRALYAPRSNQPPSGAPSATPSAAPSLSVCVRVSCPNFTRFHPIDLGFDLQATLSRPRHIPRPRTSPRVPRRAFCFCIVFVCSG